ncbi:phosphopantetheine-binding protein [Nocardia vinacea]|uniref:phosphopantetheine-binding protein n=1 Tax=Nocardia vinacea TaxID=96468 RepID=UPI0033F0E639
MTVVSDVLVGIKRAAMSHEDVADAEAFEILNHGTVGLAIVPKSFANAVEIRNHVLATSNENEVLTTVALVDNLPRDTQGYAKPEEVAAIVGRLPETYLAVYEPASTDTESSIISMLVAVTRTPIIGMRDDFVDIGVDSAAAVRLSSLLEEKFGIELQLGEVFRAATANGLAFLIEDHRRARPC